MKIVKYIRGFNHSTKFELKRARSPPVGKSHDEKTRDTDNIRSLDGFHRWAGGNVCISYNLATFVVQFCIMHQPWLIGREQGENMRVASWRVRWREEFLWQPN